MKVSDSTCITVAGMLDRIMEIHGLRSDYALAKYLKARVQVISNYRNKKTLPDEVMAKRIAQELGLPWGYVLALIAAERASKGDNPELANTWADVAKKIGISACMLVGIGMVSMDPSPAQAAQNAPPVYYVKSSRSRKQGLAAVRAPLRSYVKHAGTAFLQMASFLSGTCQRRLA